MIVSFRPKATKAIVLIKNSCVKLPLSYTQDIFGERKMCPLTIKDKDNDKRI